MRAIEIEPPRRSGLSPKRLFAWGRLFKEHRAFERAEASVFGFVHADRASCRECIVQNYSEGGARLNTLGAPLPAVFTLEIPSLRKMRPARVIWRRGRDIGVAFEKSPRPTEESSVHGNPQ